jgi:hypothetical protein
MPLELIPLFEVNAQLALRFKNTFPARRPQAILLERLINNMPFDMTEQ